MQKQWRWPSGPRAHAIFVGIALCLIFSRAHAKGGEFALGAVFGDPTGLSLRGEVVSKAHIQGVLGYGFFPGGGPTLGMDVRFDLYDFLKHNPTLALYFNAGPGLSLHWFSSEYFVYGKKQKGEPDRFGLGLHALFGLRLAWRNEPFEMVFDLSPFGLVATTHSEVLYDIEISFGFRYRF